MKYKIKIPQPSAKRLENYRLLIIEQNDGWSQLLTKDIVIPCNYCGES